MKGKVLRAWFRLRISVQGNTKVRMRYLCSGTRVTVSRNARVNVKVLTKVQARVRKFRLGSGRITVKKTKLKVRIWDRLPIWG